MRWDQSRALGAVGVAGLCAGLPPQSPVDKPLPAQRLFLPDHPSLQAGQVGSVGGRPSGYTSAIWASRAECGLTPLELAHCTWSNCVSLQRVQFGMYALYSKNKPRSDALMTSYGHVFFRVGEPEPVAGEGMEQTTGSSLTVSDAPGRTSSRHWGTTWTWPPTC